MSGAYDVGFPIHHSTRDSTSPKSRHDFRDVEYSFFLNAFSARKPIAPMPTTMLKYSNGLIRRTSPYLSFRRG